MRLRRRLLPLVLVTPMLGGCTEVQPAEPPSRVLGAVVGGVVLPTLVIAAVGVALCRRSADIIDRDTGRPLDPMAVRRTRWVALGSAAVPHLVVAVAMASALTAFREPHDSLFGFEEVFWGSLILHGCSGLLMLLGQAVAGLVTARSAGARTTWRWVLAIVGVTAAFGSVPLAIWILPAVLASTAVRPRQPAATH